jgi:hypothetical protein
MLSRAPKRRFSGGRLPPEPTRRPRREILELGNLTFIDEREDALFSGSPLGHGHYRPPPADLFDLAAKINSRQMSASRLRRGLSRHEYRNSVEPRGVGLGLLAAAIVNASLQRNET